MSTTKIARQSERRTKARFPLHRPMRYKLLQNSGSKVQAGDGQTLDISSAGIAFTIDREVSPDTYVELSISWPVLLDDSCPMRLIVFGRLLRTDGCTAISSIDKYEFRTAPRKFQAVAAPRSDGMLQRWADSVRKGMLKDEMARA